MAVVFVPEAGVSRTARGYSVSPENLVILPDLSGRMDATDVKELSLDIEENGQLEPAVCWKNKAGWPVLAAGHRRYRAIVMANERIPEGQEKRRLEFVTIAAKTEAEAFDFTIRENRHRANPSPLDDAHNMHIYQTKFGLGVEQIAKKYFPGMTTDEQLQKAVKEIKDTLGLLELSETAQEELRAGKISTSAALQLAAIPSRKVQDEVIADAKAKGKKVTTEVAKDAKAAASGQTTPRVSNNLRHYKDLAEIAAVLAAEVMGDDPKWENLIDNARLVLIKARNMGVPLLPGIDSLADKLIKDQVDPTDDLSKVNEAVAV